MSADVIIPQPPTWPIVGNLPSLDMDAPLQSLMKISRELGPICRMKFPNQTLLLVSSHELVDELSDTSRFEKSVHGPLRQIRDFAGDGLFTAETDEPNWGKAHRILMPALGPLAMRDYFDAMVDIAEQMLTKWERLTPGTEIDVADNMTRLTLDTIALCGFGFRFNSFYQREMHPFVESMVRALKEADLRSARLPLQTLLMLQTQRSYRSDIEYMNEMADKIIAERRANTQANLQEQKSKDILSLMLAGRDPKTGEGLSDVNIRHQLVTFLIAGHETTSGMLSFTIHHLLQHPEVLGRAQREVDEVLGEEAPRFEHLTRLDYLDQVLRESLRLWPTAPAYGVHPREDTVLAGRYPLSAGDELLVLLPMLHRDPVVWEDPERFDPERFSPERIGQIPTNAWKPFGNGQRACIGRPFAMQEAKLVLAMMLRRFELQSVGDYELKVKETLTLKPEGLRIKLKARLNAHGERATEGSASPVSLVPSGPVNHADVSAKSDSTASSAHSTPLLVLYGSNSGSTEAFARRVATDAAARGWAVELAPMDEFAERLPNSGALIIATASYNGLPPDNAARFCRWLETLTPGALEGLRYAVLGCGNRDWAATYQSVPRQVDEDLHRAGAIRLVPRGEADAGDDFFGDFEEWYSPLLSTFEESFQVEGATEKRTPLYKVAHVDATEQDPRIDAHGTHTATVLENRELVDMSSPLGRSKRHLELKLPPGISYSTGDYLVILPENDPDRVTRAARRFSLDPQDVVLISRTQEVASALPTDRPIKVGELLSRHIELNDPASRRDLQQVLDYTECPPEKMRLQRLVDDKEHYRGEVLDKRVSLLEILEETASCSLGFGQFLEMLAPMRPRQYSISSSPCHNEQCCSLTVAVVDAPAWSGSGQYRGTGSYFLSALKEGSSLEVAVRNPNQAFHPPKTPDTPMILIAAGSGLAPFRGFIQERAAEPDSGPIALFFGCDSRDVDLLYSEELHQWEEQGLIETYLAFSENPEEEDVYFVQHRLWKERSRVKELLDQGAYIFVCGDGSKMAPAVRGTLTRICTEASAADLEDSLKQVESLVKEGRYVEDIFS